MNKANRNFILARDVLTVYHSDYIDNDKKNFILDMIKRGYSSQRIRKIIGHPHPLTHPTHYDFSNLMEECIAHVGGYNFIDGSGKDFDDISESDAKLISLYKDNGKRCKSKSYRGIVRTNNKIGALRVLCVNEFTNGIDFFFIPKEKWEFLVTNNKDGRIHFYYDSRFERYTERLREFQIFNFKEFCKKQIDFV
jgi:hypothetical protein